MFVLSSFGSSSLSNLVGNATEEQEVDSQHSADNLPPPCSEGSPFPDNESMKSAIAYNNNNKVFYFHDDIASEDDDDGVSYGGTIIDSLSSKEVNRNIGASRAFDAHPQTARSGRIHPLALTSKTTLSEVATVQSDVLSFTPTMAEYELSRQLHRPDAISTVDITHVQPDKIACPFCDREKDLQWRLSREREQSQDLQLSHYKMWFLLIATTVTFTVAVLSFFLGKAVSDIQSEKMLSQYMDQCSEMMSQKEGEELYWKLVTAAFSAISNALAGPLANYVLGAGK